VLENKVLRRGFGSKKEEVAGDWRRMRNVELHNLNSSQYVIRVVISRNMISAGHVARMVKDGACKILAEIL
jgi:hypothetical protein